MLQRKNDQFIRKMNASATSHFQNETKILPLTKVLTAVSRKNTQVKNDNFEVERGCFFQKFLLFLIGECVHVYFVALYLKTIYQIGIAAKSVQTY